MKLPTQHTFVDITCISSHNIHFLAQHAFPHITHISSHNMHFLTQHAFPHITHISSYNTHFLTTYISSHNMHFLTQHAFPHTTCISSRNTLLQMKYAITIHSWGNEKQGATRSVIQNMEWSLKRNLDRRRKKPDENKKTFQEFLTFS